MVETSSIADQVRGQLADRRGRLERALAEIGQAADLVRLLREVDRALQRVETGAFALCDVCHTPIDGPDLIANPVGTWCLCRLSPAQQRALEHDLALAARTQLSLLPCQDLEADGWTAHHRYLSLGAVSGDVIDVVARPGGGLEVLFGDVSGKGVAASFLMAQLNALFRSLIDLDLAVETIVARANRLIADSSLAAQYATLVCARALADGAVELCNAGHPPPLVLRRDRVEPLGASGLPVGLIKPAAYASLRVDLAPGDTLFFYTDGVTEAANPKDEELGIDRLAGVVEEHRSDSPAGLAAAVLAAVDDFRDGAPPADDVSLLVLRRV